jgi:hypothetical protein
MQTKENIAKRLGEVVKNVFPTNVEAGRRVQETLDIKIRTFDSHRLAQRAPSRDQMRKYADFFGVSLEWLENGVGSKWDHTKQSRINQLTRDYVENPSQNGAVRIILSVSEHNTPRVAGMAVALPEGLCASPRAQAWQIPLGDFSMIGGEHASLPPGTWVIADPERDITPGSLILCRPDGFSDWCIRRYSADVPYKAAKKYTLLSANPSLGFEAIVVRRKSSCEVLGRVVYSVFEL